MGVPAGRVDPAKARQRPLPTPKPLDRHGPARIVAMCNQKGGVGKTTSTINLGAALVEHGRRVLLVDLDPQGALSVGLGIQSQQLERTVYNALMERHTTLRDVIVRNVGHVRGLDLAPSNIDLSAAEVQLVSEVAREQSLLRVLAEVRQEYDYVLIDCQPSLGLLTVNALTAAQGVIIPLECEFFSSAASRCWWTPSTRSRSGSTPPWRSTASWPRCTTRGPCTPARCSAAWSRRSGTPCSRP
ncbi:ParA family protein [Klenkia terrae]